MTAHLSAAKVLLVAASSGVIGAASVLATDNSVTIALVQTLPQIITSLAALISAIVGVVVLLRVGEVHTLTNRNFTEQKQEIADLRIQLAEGASKLGAQKSLLQTAESTRITLAAETKAEKKE